jgi:hypothetical protein
VLRSVEEIEASFATVVEMLDGALRAARPELDGSGVSVLDRSNRSCFDKSGFPYCVWEHVFLQKFRHGSGIAQTAARITFFEPLDTSDRRIRLEWVAEIYQLGQVSFFKASERYELPMTELQLGSTVAELLLLARRRLEEERVDFSEPIAG